jgi:hypothetical protein
MDQHHPGGDKTANLTGGGVDYHKITEFLIA